MEVELHAVHFKNTNGLFTDFSTKLINKQQTPENIKIVLG